MLETKSIYFVYQLFDVFYGFPYLETENTNLVMFMKTHNSNTKNCSRIWQLNYKLNN
jgi:hypothetical protein